MGIPWKLVRNTGLRPCPCSAINYLLIMLTPVVFKLAFTWESPGELPKILMSHPIPRDCDLSGLRYGLGTGSFTRCSGSNVQPSRGPWLCADSVMFEMLS